MTNTAPTRGFGLLENFLAKKAMEEFFALNATRMLEKYDPKYILVHFNEIKPPLHQITPIDLEKIEEFQLVYNSQNIYVYEFSNKED